MQAADLRQTVLDASLDLIEERGLTALSMREVARRAGVSHQAPYHHFGDREGILAALATDGFSRLHNDMLKAVNKLTDPVERLEAVGRAYISFALRNQGHFKLMFRSDVVEVERFEELQICADKAFTLLTSIVGEVAKSRGEKDQLPLAIASWSLAHGVATLLLEGKLVRHFGKGQTQQRAGAAAVLKAFGSLFA